MEIRGHNEVLLWESGGSSDNGHICLFIGSAVKEAPTSCVILGASYFLPHGRKLNPAFGRSETSFLLK